jgi:hypothetical protein
MNFNAAYQILGRSNETLLQRVVDEINRLTDTDYNYQDFDSKTGDKSWLRLDFMTAPTDEKYLPLYSATKQLVDDIAETNKLDPVTSFSISTLKPKQVLEEHTDGRFIHRITNRYLVPLTHSDVNYNYGYYNNEKVIYPLKFGNIYRINNAIVHSAVNLEDTERYNILIDTFETRLKDKFEKFTDIMAPLSDEGFRFSKARGSLNKHDSTLTKFASRHR